MSSSVHPSWAGAPASLRALVVAVPTTIAAVPIVLAAGRTAVFRDEVATAQLATLPPGDLWRATEHADRVVLPYLLVMKGWLAVAGDSTFALRVPSVVAAVGLVAVLAVLGGRLAGPVGGVVAALAAGAAPLVPKVAVLARPYAMAAFVAVLAVLVLHLALGSGHRGWWVAHAALVTASVLVQPFAAAALPAHVALVAGTPARPWRRLLSGWAVALGAAAVVAVGSRGQQGQVGWIAEVDPGGALVMVRDALSGPVVWLAVAGAVVGLVLVVTRRSAPWCWVGGALVLAPPLLLAIVTAVLQPAFVPRYLFLVPAGAALLAGGAAGAVADLLARREPAATTVPRMVTAVALAGLLVLGVGVLGRDGGLPTDAYRATSSWSADPESALAQAVGEALRPGDLLVVEQRVGWGGYAGELARAWGDDDLAAALADRAVSGDLADITRVVASTGPPRTVAAGEATPTGVPARVVLLSLRSTAADRFVAAAPAGCTAGKRVRDPRLRDTRLWVLQCDSTPGSTDLSAAPDDPVR